MRISLQRFWGWLLHLAIRDWQQWYILDMVLKFYLHATKMMNKKRTITIGRNL